MLSDHPGTRAAVSRWQQLDEIIVQLLVIMFSFSFFFFGKDKFFGKTNAREYETFDCIPASIVVRVFR